MTQTKLSRMPRLIGLCGNPKAGKSEVQTLLAKHFRYQPVDDGYVLRKFCVDHLGLTWGDVLSQEGKARSTEILGKNWVHRDILGTLGAHLEEMFGEHFMPFVSTRSLEPDQRYSFGSVRKTQGQFYRAQGGLVIEVKRDSALPSPYAFDKYDPAAVSHTIDNNGTLEDLEEAVVRLIHGL